MKKIKLVEITGKKFVLEPRYYFFGWSKSSKILGRQSAIVALSKAEKLLPAGYKFKIWDCFRPREVQIAMVDSFKKRLRVMHPAAPPKQLKQLVERYAGKVPPPLKIERLDTHRNGGSFDLTVADDEGRELYMGTDHDDLTPKAATDYFEKIKGLTGLEREAKKNRRLLAKTLTQAGFINYKEEWWHWSWAK